MYSAQTNITIKIIESFTVDESNRKEPILPFKM